VPGEAQFVIRLVTVLTVRNRISLEARSSVIFRTFPGSHPFFCARGTWSFLVLKQPDLGFDNIPSFQVPCWNERVELCLQSANWRVSGLLKFCVSNGKAKALISLGVFIGQGPLRQQRGN